LNIAEIDLCACLRAVAARFAPAAEAAGIAFAERFAEPRIVVQADRERLEQAVAMLFDNAIKFNRAGTTVRVLYLDDGEEEEFTIVGARESDPMNNKISNESPVGTALLGHKSGETVSVEAPDGAYELKILEIKI